MKCMNVIQCNTRNKREKHKKPRNKEQWYKGKAMKHKDYVRKTQLV